MKNKNLNRGLVALFLIVTIILVIPATVYSIDEEQNLGEAIVVNVDSYEPTVLKSQMIEERNVPVGAKVEN